MLSKLLKLKSETRNYEVSVIDYELNDIQPCVGIL